MDIVLASHSSVVEESEAYAVGVSTVAKFHLDAASTSSHIKASSSIALIDPVSVKDILQLVGRTNEMEAFRMTS